MLDETHLNEQRENVSLYLQDRFNVQIDDLPNFKEFADSSLKSILSIKIWKKYLKENNTVLQGPDQYVDEIISNLNQVLVMGVLGFKIPSYIMLRRSLENTMSFLYYKDHSIEFFLKEYEPTKKNFLRISELEKYIVDYPFYVQYETHKCKKIKILLKRVIDVWSKQYKDLSNFVHGTNSKYLELNNYLDDISSENSTLMTLTEYIQSLSSMVNTLNIIFFFNIYKKFDEDEKSLIRWSISCGIGFKRDLIEIFGEV